MVKNQVYQIDALNGPWLMTTPLLGYLSGCCVRIPQVRWCYTHSIGSSHHTLAGQWDSWSRPHRLSDRGFPLMHHLCGAAVQKSGNIVIYSSLNFKAGWWLYYRVCMGCVPVLTLVHSSRPPWVQSVLPPHPHLLVPWFLHSGIHHILLCVSEPMPAAHTHIVYSCTCTVNNNSTILVTVPSRRVRCELEKKCAWNIDGEK